jgi:Flp pilus assembly protein TadG
MKRKMRRNENGYVLFLMAAVAFALCGACGLALDVGRMYIVRNELQAFADSAALAAALRLDGTSTGIQRARDEVTRIASLNKWNLGTQQPASDDMTVEFGLSPTGVMPASWSANPASASNYSYTRVRVAVDMPVYMIAAVTGTTTYSVAARAVAGQLPLTGSPKGMFPFTPLAHSNTGPNFGLSAGTKYTLKWPSSPSLNGCPSSPNCNVCAGDQSTTWIDRANSRGSQNRGYYGEQTSAADAYDQVANDAPVEFFTVGQIIPLTGGAKSTVKDALWDRVNADPDTSSTTFAQYKQRGHSRRIITVPITDPLDQNRVVGFGRFFLGLASHYQNAQGNDPWCAEYIGPGSAEGSDSTGASPSAGLTVVRLADE